MKTRKGLKFLFIAVTALAVVKAAGAECRGVPMGDLVATPLEVWNPGNNPAEIFVEGRFIQPDGCSFRFARINVVDEYAQLSFSQSIPLTENGNFSKRFTMDARAAGRDHDGRRFVLSVAAVNEAGVGVASADIRFLHHPSRR